MAGQESRHVHDKDFRTFASDNYAGAHPDVMAALLEANGGHVVSYGADPWTERLGEIIRRQFGEQAQVFPMFNGTGANVVGLQALLPRWGAVICSEAAHINTDENGAPERVAALKLLTVPTLETNGKLTPELVGRQAWGFGDEHRAQPAAVSVTQATEVGTVYTPAELADLAAQAHGLGMRLHMDGARLANAAAALGLPLRAVTTDVGLDVLSLGGTKNGALFAEAVVVLAGDDPTLAGGLKYLRKMNMQLASKMRFLSAQLVALYEGDLWRRLAEHSNKMASQLARSLAAVDGVRISQPTEANGVFAVLPPGVADRVRETFPFYDWDWRRGEVRLMCAWDTTEDDVERFVAEVHKAAAGAPGPTSP